MPHFREYKGAHLQIGEMLIPDWTKRPFPTSWDEFEAAVIDWVNLVWPEWSCPHCKHRFWSVLEAVRLDSAVAWPIKDDSSHGAYPVVPVACSWCGQTTPILLLRIFEGVPGAVVSPAPTS